VDAYMCICGHMRSNGSSYLQESRVAFGMVTRSQAAAVSGMRRGISNSGQGERGTLCFEWQGRAPG